MSDVIDQAAGVRRDAKALREALSLPDVEGMSHAERTDLWINAKRAADYLYSIVKQAAPLLLAEAGQTKGWVGSDGTGIDVRSKFEVEVLDEDRFSAWCQDRDITPLEARWQVTAAAKQAVADALYEDGEAVPGVSAGQGAPYLAINRRRGA